MVQQLNDLLNGYHNKDFIINGFTEGFRLKFEGEDLPLDSKNSQSAINNPEAVNLKLKQEINLFLQFQIAHMCNRVFISQDIHYHSVTNSIMYSKEEIVFYISVHISGL